VVELINFGLHWNSKGNYSIPFTEIFVIKLSIRAHLLYLLQAHKWFFSRLALFAGILFVDILDDSVVSSVFEDHIAGFIPEFILSPLLRIIIPHNLIKILIDQLSHSFWPSLANFRLLILIICDSNQKLYELISHQLSSWILLTSFVSPGFYSSPIDSQVRNLKILVKYSGFIEKVDVSVLGNRPNIVILARWRAYRGIMLVGFSHFLVILPANLLYF